jgi:tRNA pseudouridine38-40 synthase
MTRIRLDIRYDGSGYSGWQKQPKKNAPPTIQAALELALLKLTGLELSTVGSGRTDAGTHARHQVVHFDFPEEAEKYPWVRALNSKLPEQIQVFEAYEAPSKFHALLSAQAKHYIYYLHNSPLPPLFRRRYTGWQKAPLSLEWLNETAKMLVGRHDFRSFQNTGTDVPSTVRTLFRAEWLKTGPQTIEFHVVGNGFLKQMVRNIVGTQIDMAIKKHPTHEFLKIFQARDRNHPGPTAPALGLFLHQVSYSRELDNKCRKL